jgi:hypothetical protein
MSKDIVLGVVRQEDRRATPRGPIRRSDRPGVRGRRRQ